VYDPRVVLTGVHSNPIHDSPIYNGLVTLTKEQTIMDSLEEIRSDNTGGDWFWSFVKAILLLTFGVGLLFGVMIAAMMR
jgi:hypothetical protein